MYLEILLGIFFTRVVYKSPKKLRNYFKTLLQKEVEKLPYVIKEQPLTKRRNFFLQKLIDTDMFLKAFWCNIFIMVQLWEKNIYF